MLTALFVVVAAVIGAVLNRIRGGWLKDKLWNSTHAVRAVWAIPTGLYVWWLSGFAGNWLVPVELVASSFASYALLGHGGHMVYSEAWWRQNWKRPVPAEQTELTTRFWLVPLFGGEPGPLWDMQRVYLFHLTGMAFIGTLRSLLIVLPLFFVGFVIGPLVFTALGALLGILYLVGWQFREDIKLAELIVGAFYWVSLFFLIGENHV